MSSLEERVAELELRNGELAENVADLHVQLGRAWLAVDGLHAELSREVAELHTRITTVHNQALRELTRRAGRNTTA